MQVTTDENRCPHAAILRTPFCVTYQDVIDALPNMSCREIFRCEVIGSSPDEFQYHPLHI
jgi:hypothetical protein